VGTSDAVAAQENKNETVGIKDQVDSNTTLALFPIDPKTLMGPLPGARQEPGVMGTSILRLQSFLQLRYLTLSHDHEHNN
jgi:hypothetical protein